MEVRLNNAKFTLEKIEDGWDSHIDDSLWESVCLPHDWAVTRSFSKEYSSGTGYLPGGTGWYRIHFNIPEDAENYDISVVFEGVYKHAYCWCNQYYLGMHANGYTNFSYNISHAVLAGKDNILTVKVCHEDIADSRWYTGSGIERPVKLLIQPKIHEIESERFIKIINLNEKIAEIESEHLVINSGNKDAAFAISEYINDDEIQSVEGEIKAGEKKTVKLKYSIENPVRWSPNRPYLYNIKTDVITMNAADTITWKLGLVKTEFDSDKGFLCNGNNIKLKGVCLHEDAGSFGNAVPENVWRRRLCKLKDMGANTIRMSHNPHSECLYNLCDELGFFVIDEVFDEWEGPKNKWWHGHNVYPPKHQGYFMDYPQWHEIDVESFVKSRRNHPSVIMWSIGNEIDYPNDPYCHKSFGEMTGNNDAGKPAQEKLYDERKPDAIRLVALAKKLTELVKKYDDTRPVSLASAFPELSSNTGLFDSLDVIGYNYKEQFYEQDHQRFPDKPIFGSENGHDYKAWKYVIDNDYISGQCLWTGIDYLGETRGWPEHGSRAGHMTTAGFEKADYFFRKSMWDEENFFVKLATCAEGTDSWMEYRKFVWDYEQGSRVQVEAYSNLEEVELFINGTSQGCKHKDENGKFIWVVPYEAGTISAIGMDSKGNKYEDTINTLNVPKKIAAKLIDEKIPADGIYISQIQIDIVDDSGKICNNAKIPIKVRTEGEITFEHMDNGNLADVSDYTSVQRCTYEGHLMIYVRSTDKKGLGTVYINSDEIEDAKLEINTI
ncbi:MAG: DUF4982 domain-containing protein [Butyrivibrio sp.]|nr:DUF4982 domain-containing protein [Butyrivibrio sp.]